MVKIVLDTNIWISYLISKDFNWLDGLIMGDQAQLLFSERLLAEFVRVANRSKFKKYFSEESLRNLFDRFEEYGRMVAVHSSSQMCRDPDDDFLLHLAIDGKADYLVTGDHDLLILKKIEACKIITLRELKDIFGYS